MIRTLMLAIVTALTCACANANAAPTGCETPRAMRAIGHAQHTRTRRHELALRETARRADTTAMRAVLAQIAAENAQMHAAEREQIAAARMADAALGCR